MIRGLYASSNGMLTQLKKMDVVSNNLANADTSGFKKDGVTTASFDEMLIQRINGKTGKNESIGTMNFGVTVDKVYTDFTQGSFKQTGNPVDLALVGKGFLTTSEIDKNGKEQIRYTRDGSLTLDGEGVLRTKNGSKVVGQNGEIKLNGGDIFVNKQGEVYVNGDYVDTLKLVNFEDSENLRKIGNNLYSYAGENEPINFTGSVSQGFLESSNINTVREMVEMISVTRAYETNQKVLQMNDQTLGKAVNEVGKL